MRKLRSVCTPALLIPAAFVLVIATANAQPPQQSRSGVARAARGGARSEKPGITSEQMERLEARIATATAIVNRFARDAKARGLASGWRQATLETLLSLSLDALRQVEQQAFNLDALASATEGAAEDAQALGDTNKDLVYTPITPCRFIDTRNAGGKINGVRGFDADLTGATYGGVAACNPTALFGVFADQIGALAMNVTVFDTSTAPAPGFVAAKPSAAAPSTSLLNWYDQGPTVQIANHGIVSLAQTILPSEDFVIQTSGPVHIIVDIFGGFIAPQATTLQTIHVFDSIVIPNLVGRGKVSPKCPIGYDMTGGGCFTDQFGHYITSSDPTTSKEWFCSSYNTSGVDSVLFARAICARTPGR